MRWLDVPLPLLGELLKRIPQLRGEESLRRASEIAVGTGSVRRDDASSIRAQWSREAAGESVARPRGARELVAAARSMGISVVQESA